MSEIQKIDIKEKQKFTVQKISALNALVKDLHGLLDTYIYINRQAGRQTEKEREHTGAFLGPSRKAWYCPLNQCLTVVTQDRQTDKQTSCFKITIT